METLKEYFARPETPAAGSPIGTLMARIVEKNLGIRFEDARAQSHTLYRQAAGRRKFVLPQVLSPEEQTAARNQLIKFRESRQVAVQTASTAA